MHEGVTLDLQVERGTPDEEFVAVAVGNAAAFRLSQERKESLQWQILRVEGGHDAHYRLVLMHPDRSVDIGLRHSLEKKLDMLSSLGLDGLRREFEECKRQGLVPVRLRHVRENYDTWSDDFWNWLG